MVCTAIFYQIKINAFKAIKHLSLLKMNWRFCLFHIIYWQTFIVRKLRLCIIDHWWVFLHAELSLEIKLQAQCLQIFPNNISTRWNKCLAIYYKTDQFYFQFLFLVNSHRYLLVARTLQTALMKSFQSIILRLTIQWSTIAASFRKNSNTIQLRNYFCKDDRVGEKKEKRVAHVDTSCFALLNRFFMAHKFYEDTNNYVRWFYVTIKSLH